MNAIKLSYCSKFVGSRSDAGCVAEASPVRRGASLKRSRCITGASLTRSQSVASARRCEPKASRVLTGASLVLAGAKPKHRWDRRLSVAKSKRCRDRRLSVAEPMRR
nr:hypothetical protein CFP56_25548 [Quercus suber]